MKKKPRLGSFLPCWLAGTKPATVAAHLNWAIANGRLRAKNWAAEPGDNFNVAICVRPDAVQGHDDGQRVLRKEGIVALMVRKQVKGELLRAIARVARKWHLPLIGENGRKIKKGELGREQDAPPSAGNRKATRPAWWLHEAKNDLEMFDAITRRVVVVPMAGHPWLGAYNTQTGEIAIVESYPEIMVETLVHEVAHALDFELGQAGRFSEAEAEAVAHWVAYMVTKRGLNLLRLESLAADEGISEEDVPGFLRKMRRRAARLLRRHETLFELVHLWGIMSFDV